MDIYLSVNPKVYKELHKDLAGLSESEAANRILLLASCQVITSSFTVEKGSKENDLESRSFVVESEGGFTPQEADHRNTKKEEGEASEFDACKYAEDFDNDSF